MSVFVEIGIVGVSNLSVLFLFVMYRFYCYIKTHEKAAEVLSASSTQFGDRLFSLSWSQHRKRCIFHVLLLLSVASDIPMYSSFIVTGLYEPETYAFHKLQSMFLFIAFSMTIFDWSQLLYRIDEIGSSYFFLRKSVLFGINAVVVLSSLLSFSILIENGNNLTTFTDSPEYKAQTYVQIVAAGTLTLMMLHAGVKLHRRISGAGGEQLNCRGADRRSVADSSEDGDREGRDDEGEWLDDDSDHLMSNSSIDGESDIGDIADMESVNWKVLYRAASPDKRRGGDSNNGHGVRFKAAEDALRAGSDAPTSISSDRPSDVEKERKSSGGGTVASSGRRSWYLSTASAASNATGSTDATLCASHSQHYPSNMFNSKSYRGIEGMGASGLDRDTFGSKVLATSGNANGIRTDQIDSNDLPESHRRQLARIDAQRRVGEDASRHLQDCLMRLNMVMLICLTCILLSAIYNVIGVTSGTDQDPDTFYGPPLVQFCFQFWVPLWGPVLSMLFLARTRNKFNSRQSSQGSAVVSSDGKEYQTRSSSMFTKMYDFIFAKNGMKSNKLPGSNPLGTPLLRDTDIESSDRVSLAANRKSNASRPSGLSSSTSGARHVDDSDINLSGDVRVLDTSLGQDATIQYTMPSPGGQSGQSVNALLASGANQSLLNESMNASLLSSTVHHQKLYQPSYNKKTQQQKSQHHHQYDYGDDGGGEEGWSDRDSNVSDDLYGIEGGEYISRMSRQSDMSQHVSGRRSVGGEGDNVICIKCKVSVNKKMLSEIELIDFNRTGFCKSCQEGGGGSTSSKGLPPPLRLAIDEGVYAADAAASSGVDDHS